ncbi:hypothetical protein EV128_13142 [Rhizobium azibense]|nr:hypothetical protein EV128_13142 [Rhizobium azibense]
MTTLNLERAAEIIRDLLQGWRERAKTFERRGS